MAKKFTPDLRHIIIINIYNDQEHDNTIATTEAALHDVKIRHRRRYGRHQPPLHVVWAGDFNRHHPMWERLENTHLLTQTHLEASLPILNFAATHELQQILPEGEPTLVARSTGNHTRPDNVFTTAELAECLIACETMPELMPPNTDHYPIRTTLQVAIRRTEQRQRWNWREVDWSAFEDRLRQELEARDIATEKIQTEEEFNVRLAMVMESIQVTREAVVTRKKPSPRSKRWWTKQLAKQKNAVRKLARTSYRFHYFEQHPIHGIYRQARNKYQESIQKAKQDHWETYLENVDAESIWNFSRYVKTGARDGGQTSIPNLRYEPEVGKERLTETNREKCEALGKVFFPRPGRDPNADGSIVYPPPRFEFCTIPLTLVQEILRSLKCYKAAGIDDIPNEVYKNCAHLLDQHLYRLFEATFTLKVYPQEWRMARIVVLRKPGKKDYTAPNAYRPIALLPCIAKILAACVTRIVTKQAECLPLISKNHFLGRPGRTTTDSIHYITSIIKDAWRKRQCAAVLFLDNKAAFPSVTPERLFHNARMRGIPEEIVDWMKRKMTGRTAVLTFDDYESEPIPITGGIDQGSPSSVIDYQVYNSDILDLVDAKNGTYATGNIDDVAIIAVGTSCEDAHDKLRELMTKQGGGFEWADEHNTEFSVEKFGLINCQRATRELGPDLDLGRAVIQPAKSHLFLGVLIDYQLRWTDQVIRAEGKGLQWTALMKRMANTKKGVSMAMCKKLYLTVAVPSYLYAADVFLAPPFPGAGCPQPRGAKGHMKRLERIHRQAAIIMTGAMRTTATDVLEVNANLTPFPHIVDKICYRAALRVCALPPTHPLSTYVTKVRRYSAKRHRSSLHDLIYSYNLFPRQIETISPVRFPPLWKPKHKTEINEDKEEAEKLDRAWRQRAKFHIYSDGSDIDGGVGSAAIMFIKGRRGMKRKVLRHYLGSSDEHTVYEAELVGMILGLQLLKTVQTEITGRVFIALDNRAAILAARVAAAGPAHYLLDHFHQTLNSLKRKHRGMKLTVRWVPGHEGIDGNEDADEEAKCAAHNNPSENARLPAILRKKLPQSISKLKQVRNAETKKIWATTWAASKRSRKIGKIDPSLPSDRFATLIAELPRRHASLLLQLRTGHAPLHYHLHKIGVSPSPLCPACDEQPETVDHFLLRCPAYERHRLALNYELGRAARSIPNLLSNASTLRPLFRYIHATKRFRRTLGELSLRPAKEKGAKKK